MMPPEIQRAIEAKARGQSVEIPDTVFCTQVKASLGGVNSFREVLATGQPAEGYAQRLVELAKAAGGDPYRNFVCPGFEIPKPSSDAGPQAIQSKPKP